MLLALLLIGCDIGPKSKQGPDAPSETYKEWNGEYEGSTDIFYYDQNEELERSHTDLSALLSIDLSNSEDGEVIISSPQVAGPTVGGEGVVGYLTSDSLFAGHKVQSVRTEFELTKESEEVSGKVEVFDIDSEDNARIRQVWEFTVTRDQK